MFDRFTDRARQTILEAQAEAVEHTLDFIGTEHLLLGLMRVGSGVAHDALAHEGVELSALREKVVARVGELVGPDGSWISKADALAAIGIDLQSVKSSVEATFGPGSLPDPGSTPVFTPGAKAALMASLRRVRGLRQRFIGTEHVLLGLFDDRDSYACLVLGDLGIDVDALERRVVERVAPAETRVEAAWQAISQFQLEAAGRPDAVDTLTDLARTLGQVLGDEQQAVTRLADDTALALEAALAEARARL